MQASTRDQATKVGGPSWARKDWPRIPTDELTSALDGNWPVVAEKVIGAKLEAKSAAAPAAPAAAPAQNVADVRKATMDSVRALMMIRAYRMRGHLAANLDPLGITEVIPQPELEPASYGFTEADMDRPIFLDNVLGLETATIRQIVDILQRTYCHTLGVEFMHISDPEQKSWLQQRIEGENKEINFTAEGKKAILNKLIETEGFENFLNVKYTGTKRFGLDGGESMVPALEQIINRLSRNPERTCDWNISCSHDQIAERKQRGCAASTYGVRAGCLRYSGLPQFVVGRRDGAVGVS